MPITFLSTINNYSFLNKYYYLSLFNSSPLNISHNSSSPLQGGRNQFVAQTADVAHEVHLQAS